MNFLRCRAGALLLTQLLVLAACSEDSQPTPPVSPSPERAVVTVTSTRSHVTTDPDGGEFRLGEGDSLALGATAEPGYTLAPVGGSCAAGTWSAGVYTTGPISASCTLEFAATLNAYVVTVSADAGLSATPVATQSVSHGGTSSYAVTAAPGFDVSVAGTCPAGELAVDSYVTGPITANCTVHFVATLGVVSVAPAGDAQTAIAPATSQSVSYGSTHTFTLTSSTGYRAVVGGSCPTGTLVGSTYTTGPLTANCTVVVASAIITSLVTPAADAHLVLTPGTTQVVNYGATQAFTVTPNPGYSLNRSFGGTCPAGSLSAGTYTTGAVTANCSVTFSSSLDWAGVRQMGVATKPTEATSVVTDAAGNVYVTGFSNGALNGGPLLGTRDAFVARYDASGVLVWLKHLGVATKSTLGKSLAIDVGGDIYLAGETTGGLNGNTASTGTEYFLARFAADGSLLWVRQSGSNARSSNLAGVATDGAGGVYVTGSTTTALHGNVQSGVWDLFVARFDADGALIWSRQVGTAGLTSFGSSIKADSSGNTFVAGATTGGIAGNTQAGTFDSVIARYDANGNRIWLKQFGSAAKIATGTGVAIDPAGNALLTGPTNAGLNGNPVSGGGDYYIAKYDVGGNVLWLKQLGVATKDTGAMAAAADPSGNVLVTGYTNAGLAGNTKTGTYDAFISKYDADGTLLWLRQLGSSGLSAGNGIATDASGSVFVGGYTDGSLPGNALAGTRDYWLAKYSPAGVLQ